MARLVRSTAQIAASGAGAGDAAAAALDQGWTVLEGCEIRAFGEVGTVELVLLSRTRGAALVALAGPEETLDAALAAAAFGSMLDEIGFRRRFRGHLAVAPLSLAPALIGDAGPEGLASRLAAAFDVLPATRIADPTWVDWLADRLARSALNQPASQETAAPDPAAPAQGELRLAAPDPAEHWGGAAEREAAWRVAPAAAPLAAEPALASAEARSARGSSWLGMALAAGVVVAVLGGMALLSHGNAPPSGGATQQTGN